MPSVKNTAGIKFLNSSSSRDEYGALPLLCHVSKTNGSRLITPSHLLQCISILSIQGRCNSKFVPSGNLDALFTISFLENNPSFKVHLLHFQIGKGVPQTLSLDIHQGTFSFMISINRFFGGS